MFYENSTMESGCVYSYVRFDLLMGNGKYESIILGLVQALKLAISFELWQLKK